jgi:hypothetical protein
MDYAARMPHTPPQVAVFGVVALLAGAGGALGIAAIADDSTPAPQADVVIAQSQAPTSGPDEATTAGSVGSQAGSLQSAGPNEAAIAASVGTEAGSATDSAGPDEANTANAVGGTHF